MSRRVRVRARAERQLDEVIDHYAAEDPRIATRFVGAFERTLRRLAERPATGSPRFAALLDFPGLRHVMVPRFPYLVFFLITDDWVDVIAVLHGSRDMFAILRRAE
jgi:toxin ParE1/3/4